MGRRKREVGEEEEGGTDVYHRPLPQHCGWLHPPPIHEPSHTLQARPGYTKL